MNPLTLLALFGAGVASFLAPCVIPLVPAYLGMACRAAPEAGAHELVGATMLFIVGFSVEFAAFGALAGLAGGAVDPLRLWIARLGGVVVIVFGLMALGVGRRVSTGRLLQGHRPASALPESGTWRRPVVMGLVFGTAWTPCVGPLLGAALLVAARSGHVAQGAALLCAYSLGIGVPFLAAALALASLPGIWVTIRRIAHRLERVAGVILVALGVTLLTGRYGWLSSRLAESVFGLG